MINLSIVRNCGAVSTHRCNEAGDENPPPVLLTGTLAAETGDIFHLVIIAKQN